MVEPEEAEDEERQPDDEAGHLRDSKSFLMYTFLSLSGPCLCMCILESLHFAMRTSNASETNIIAYRKTVFVGKCHVFVMHYIPSQPSRAPWRWAGSPGCRPGRAHMRGGGSQTELWYSYPYPCPPKKLYRLPNIPMCSTHLSYTYSWAWAWVWMSQPTDTCFAGSSHNSNSQTNTKLQIEGLESHIQIQRIMCFKHGFNIRPHTVTLCGAQLYCGSNHNNTASRKTEVFLASVM